MRHAVLPSRLHSDEQGEACERCQDWPFLRKGVVPRVGQRLLVTVSMPASCQLAEACSHQLGPAELAGLRSQCYRRLDCLPAPDADERRCAAFSMPPSCLSLLPRRLPCHSCTTGTTAATQASTRAARAWLGMSQR